jgi:hypothetical protein
MQGKLDYFKSLYAFSERQSIKEKKKKKERGSRKRSGELKPGAPVQLRHSQPPESKPNDYVQIVFDENEAVSLLFDYFLTF